MNPFNLATLPPNQFWGTYSLFENILKNETNVGWWFDKFREPFKCALSRLPIEARQSLIEHSNAKEDVMFGAQVLKRFGC